MVAHCSHSVIWFLGVSPSDVRCIQETAGLDYRCRILDSLTVEAYHTLLDSDEDPLLLWIGESAWQDMENKSPDLMRRFFLIPSVLLLNANTERHILEAALLAHVQQVVPLPLTSELIFDAFSRARGARNIYDDMARMAREIHIGRELLDRKNEVCALFFRFFEQIADVRNARDVLASCISCLSGALGNQRAHLAWWGQNGPAYALLGLESAPESEAWLALLTDQARRFRTHAGCEGHGVKSHCVAATMGRQGKRASSAAPGGDCGQILLLPLEVRGIVCGVLALHLGENCLSGRDTAQALDAMRKHLALLLWEGSAHKNFFAEARELPLSPEREQRKAASTKAHAI